MGAADFLAKDAGLLETDGDTKLATSVCKEVDESLRALRQHLCYQYFANLSLCSKTCKVSIASGVKLHTIYLTG